MISPLIIDDHQGSLEMLSTALAQPGLEILTASDPEEGLDLVHSRRPQIVLTDLVMPRLTGLEVLERIVEFDPSIDVILMTAHYSTESAVEAVKKGATDYLNKPISIATLRERVGKLLDEARRRQNSLRLEGELLASSEFEGIIGRSPLMWDLFSQIRRVAPHYRSLLVTGPTGKGKDLIAQAVHRRSPAHAGYTTTSPWNRMDQGEEMFRGQCMNCHTLDGYRSMRKLMLGRDRHSIENLVTMLHEAPPTSPYKKFMPPVVGTREELDALVGYLDRIK